MIGALVGAAAMAAAWPPVPPMTSANWLVISIGRVIAPDQHPGECFVQGRVQRVIRGRAYRAGDAVALSLACRPDSLTPTASTAKPPPVFLPALRVQKQALVHVDDGGRVIDNGFWGLGG